MMKHLIFAVSAVYLFAVGSAYAQYPVAARPITSGAAGAFAAYECRR